MEGSEEDEEAAEPDWLLPEPGGGPCGGSLAAAGRVPSRPHDKVMSTGSAQHRIIVHLDLDCFYAQVEMICNPALRSKPLGVQQKYLVVTCNYEARNVGVKKRMAVKEAKEKCPELVLVNGEDLTKYREMSYKVTALLEEFTPLVERLACDENFVDVTDMVEMRLEQWKKDGFSTISCPGHVYKNQTVDLRDPTHRRLAVGSQIAAEMREAMHNRLGLTSCAGVASNKLLSKLVSGIFKPNQQTVLLPEDRLDLMANLDHIGKVPGIGPKTAKRLETLGLSAVCGLQACPAAILTRELGVSAAQHIQKLSWGEDDSPVTPSGPPQSLSDEDSFRKCSSEAEVRKKVEELLTNLLDRLCKDGRKPHTIRLTIRQVFNDKWLNREGRQCPIPSHVVQRIGTDDSSVKTHLVAILMTLFRKMVSVEVPFHLTLLNVCFSNLKDPPASAKHSIGFYLTRPSTSSSNGKLVHKMENTNAQNTTPDGQMDPCEVLPGARNARSIKASLETPGLPKETDILEFPIHLLPAGIDYDVFNQLPKDIKEEILSSQKGERDNAATLLSQTIPASREELSDKAQGKKSHAPLPSESTHQNISSLGLCNIASTNEELPLATYGCTPTHPVPQHNPLEPAEKELVTDCTGSVDDKNSSPALSPPSLPWTCILEGQKQPDQPDLDETAAHDAGWKEGPKLVLPPTVDPKTFSELPAEIQKELLVEWKGQDPASKMRASKTHDRLKRPKKGLLLDPQSNSLLRYFKPR